MPPANTESSGPRLPRIAPHVKYVEKVDRKEQEEIDDLPKKHTISKDMFRQNNG